MLNLFKKPNICEHTTQSESSSCDDGDSFTPENDSAKRITRWKNSNTSLWKSNKKSVKIKKSKVPKPVNCKCKFKCCKKFDEKFRNILCKKYWSLDYNQRKQFLVSNICMQAVKGTVKTKSNLKQYKFYKNCISVQVCKEFFLKTLSISHGPVDDAFKNVDQNNVFIGESHRGMHKKKCTSIESVDKVKQHIERFPVVESHYCRKNSKRMYLDPTLSIKKMYSLYLQQCENDKSKPVSEITYRRIFGKNYNLSFFKPKKDQCLICENNKNIGNNLNQAADIEYQNHLRRRDESLQAKTDDKNKAIADNSFVSATFDLQSVLQIPSSDVSPMYYSRKLCAYNFTIYESAPPNKAYCYSWTEINGQRGSSEVGTAILRWMNSLPADVKEVSLFSDTCSGQNRNKYIAALFLYAVQKLSIDVINHNFMEKGHSYMEVDSMHSAIESAKKYIPVYTMQDWLNIFKIARSKRGRNSISGEYNVEEFSYSDIKDLKELASKIIKNTSLDSDGNKVNWLKIKCFKYEKKNPNIIKFKYNYSDEIYKELYTNGKNHRQSTIKLPLSLSSLYKNPIPISDLKKKDLLKLCQTKAIPEVFHLWYKSLPSYNEKEKNTIPSSDSDE